MPEKVEALTDRPPSERVANLLDHRSVEPFEGHPVEVQTAIRQMQARAREIHGDDVRLRRRERSDQAVRRPPVRLPYHRDLHGESFTRRELVRRSRASTPRRQSSRAKAGSVTNRAEVMKDRAAESSRRWRKAVSPTSFEYWLTPSTTWRLRRSNSSICPVS